MSFDNTIKILLGRGRKGRGPLGPQEWKRVAARFAWAREMVEAWGEAQRQMDDRCAEAAGRLGKDAFERLCDEEQAKVDAIHAQIRAVVDEDTRC